MADIGSTFSSAFFYTWAQIASFLPRLFAGLIMLLIGILVAIILGKLVRTLLSYTPLDHWVERFGIRRGLDEYNIHYGIGDIIGGIVRWFFYLITLVAVADILHISELTQFLIGITYYIPNIVVAVVILTIGLIAARFLQNVVAGVLHTNTQLGARGSWFLGKVAQWAVLIFTLMAALIQLGIATSLIQILFTGFVIAASLATGLAFGLGGRDKAAQILSGTDQLSRRRQVGGV